MLNIVTTPTILTDAIFAEYGGVVANNAEGQRQTAYAIAEGQAAQEIGTFIQPTVVTGTYSWPMGVLKLDHDRIISLNSVVAIHDAGCDCADNSVEISGCAWIKSIEAGIIDVRECGNTVKASCTGCGCGQGGAGPFQVRVVYQAGLPTTALTDPRLLLGLVTAADLALEQITDPSGAEGGPGDPGVQSFSSIRYSEKRFPLKMTAFGASARANFAARTISPFKNKSALGL